MSEFGKLIGPYARKIGNMIARGVVSAVNASTKMQTLQVRLLAGETKDSVEHFEPYGLTSKPKDGAEVVSLFLDGDRSHGIVIVASDRRYRLRGLEDGEVAIYDDLGQKIHLTRNGIVVDGGGLSIAIQNAPSVDIDSPQVNMTGNLQVAGNIVAVGDVYDQSIKSMSDMRAKYNSHDHNENDSGGPTGPPNQSM